MFDDDKLLNNLSKLFYYTKYFDNYTVSDLEKDVEDAVHNYSKSSQFDKSNKSDKSSQSDKSDSYDKDKIIEVDFEVKDDSGDSNNCLNSPQPLNERLLE